MKAYVVVINNCEPYEDNRDTVDSVHLSFRGASEDLINRGFKPYADSFLGDIRLRFLRYTPDDSGWSEYEDARIMTFEVSEASV